MYKVDTLLTMKETVTAIVMVSQPEKKPTCQISCVQERRRMAMARATKVRAMHTCVGSFLYSFMYLSEITAPTHEIITFIKANTIPTIMVLVLPDEPPPFPPDAITM